jgi:hypothetical protein
VRKELFSIKRRLATGACGGDRLAIRKVNKITASEDAF